MITAAATRTVWRRSARSSGCSSLSPMKTSSYQRPNTAAVSWTIADVSSNGRTAECATVISGLDATRRDASRVADEASSRYNGTERFIIIARPSAVLLSPFMSSAMWPRVAAEMGSFADRQLWGIVLETELGLRQNYRGRAKESVMRLSRK